MGKEYKYVRLENIDQYGGWDIVEILPAKTADKYSMAVMSREEPPKCNEVISEFNARLYAYKTDIYIKGEELMIIPVSDYNLILDEMKVMFNDR